MTKITINFNLFLGLALLTLLLIACGGAVKVPTKPEAQSLDVSWQVNPNFLQVQGASDFNEQVFYLSNAGQKEGQFSISSDVNWLSVLPAKGSIASGEFQEVRVAFANCTERGYKAANLVISGAKNAQKVTVGRICTGASENPGGEETPQPDTGEFSIDVRFSDTNLTASQKAVFQSAAQRWASIITGDIPSVEATIAEDSVNGIPAFSGTIDDLLIDVQAPSIDGESGILGQAGPYALRKEGQLPYFGIMQLDKADIDSLEKENKLEAVILHEMGHVLGIGTLWDNNFKLLEYDSETCQNASSISYKGAKAVDAFKTLGGVGKLPAENSGGAGTKCGHWQEETFVNELMTGFLNYDMNNPLSRMTAGTLEDMGYQVNYANVDNYTLPTGKEGLKGLSQAIELQELLIYPQKFE